MHPSASSEMCIITAAPQRSARMRRNLPSQKCALAPAPLRFCTGRGWSLRARILCRARVRMQKHEPGSSHRANSGFWRIRMSHAETHELLSCTGAVNNNSMEQDFLNSRIVVWLDTFLKNCTAARRFKRRPLQTPSNIQKNAPPQPSLLLRDYSGRRRLRDPARCKYCMSSAALQWFIGNVWKS